MYKYIAKCLNDKGCKMCRFVVLLYEQIVN